MTTITLPRKTGITEINAYRRRAEVTVLEIGYFGQDNLAIIDGRLEIPNHPGRRTYTPRNSNLYAPDSRPRRVFINGYWKWGGDRVFEVAKVVRRNFADRIELELSTGDDEPWNTRVTIKLDRELEMATDVTKVADHLNIAHELEELEPA